MNDRWKRSNTCVYNIGYHIIWCPKYRRKVLTGDVETRLKELLLEKSNELGYKIASLEVMSDHVHIFIKADPTDSPHVIVQRLKGYTSFVLKNEFPMLKSRLPTLCTRSYYCETVGYISQATIEKYIFEQKQK